MTETSALTRLELRLAPDPNRVVARLFLPDEAMAGRHSRAQGMLGRVLALSDEKVAADLADVRRRFASRHRDLDAVFRRHFDVIGPRVEASESLSEERRLLIGAFFTAEYSTEGASLTNPSMVEHPDQSGLAPGSRRFVMSARAVGEGHFSCIAFRTGVVDARGNVVVDEPGPFLDTGQPRPRTYEKAAFWGQLDEFDPDEDIAAFVLSRVDERFDRQQLDAAIAAIEPRHFRHGLTRDTVQRLEWIALNHYDVTFDPESRIDERLLAPVGPSEGHGMEDARFTRLVGDSGSTTYGATYTAWDGRGVTPQLIETDDFRTFRISQLSGPAAKNKGMALFPRKIGGQFVSLSRYDRERSSVTRSSNCLHWEDATTLDVPLHPWQLIQTGNCGPPIETDRGWLVLTHGVGAMRTYGLGAFLLDLDDPSKVLGSSEEPLLLPSPEERGGYVPNVVYSCGGMRHGDAVILPYGYGDQRIGFALIDLPRLLDQLR